MTTGKLRMTTGKLRMTTGKLRMTPGTGFYPEILAKVAKIKQSANGE